MSARLRDDFERFKRDLPPDVAGYIREAYGINLTARYLGRTIPHPIGKGSGQLSLNVEQLETDRAAGLAFVVLKTVIGENAAGERTHGRVGAPRDEDEGRAADLRRRGGGMDGHMEGKGMGPLVRGLPRRSCAPPAGSPRRAGCSSCRRSSSTSPGWTSRSATTNIVTPSAGSRTPGVAARCRSRRISRRRSPATPLADERAPHSPLAARGAAARSATRPAPSGAAGAQADECPLRRRLSVGDDRRRGRRRRARLLQPALGCGRRRGLSADRT